MPEIIKFEELKNLASIANLASSYDTQCKLEYGPNATDCLNIQVFEGQCERLFCLPGPNSSECITNFFVADGTRCVNLNENELKVNLGRCKSGICLSDEVLDSKKPINGGWSDWQKNWSACSHYCNGGIQFKERFCNNPIPQNNGKFCLGQRKMYRTCNLHPCDSIEYFNHLHSELCKNLSKNLDFNPGIEIYGTLEHYYVPDQPCKLFCSPENNLSIYFDTNKLMPDGTRCSPFTQDVCIHGKCHVIFLKVKIKIKLNLNTNRMLIVMENWARNLFMMCVEFVMVITQLVINKKLSSI